MKQNLILLIVIPIITSLVLLSFIHFKSIKDQLNQYSLFGYTTEVYPVTFELIKTGEYKTVIKGDPLYTYRTFVYPWQNRDTQQVYEFPCINDSKEGFGIFFPEGDYTIDHPIQLN